MCIGSEPRLRRAKPHFCTSDPVSSAQLTDYRDLNDAPGIEEIVMQATPSFLSSSKKSLWDALRARNISFGSAKVGNICAQTLGFKSWDGAKHLCETNPQTVAPDYEALDTALCDYRLALTDSDRQEIIGKTFPLYAGWDWMVELYFEINTTGQDDIEESARQNGIDPTTLDWDQITEDSLQIERNILFFLKRIGMRAVDHGHHDDALLGKVVFDAKNKTLSRFAWSTLDCDDGWTGAPWDTYDFGLDTFYQDVSDLGKKLLDANWSFSFIENLPDMDNENALLADYLNGIGQAHLKSDRNINEEIKQLFNEDAARPGFGF